MKRHQDSLKKTMVVDMVEEIQRNYSPRELEGANNARRLYVIMGRPSEETFKLTLKKGLVLNNPVTVTDYENAVTIYGKDLGAIKGKNVRKKPEHVKVNVDCFPREKKVLILLVDIMYVMGMSFLIKVTRDIKFITSTWLVDKKKNMISNAMEHVINLYRGRGHMVEEMEFTEYNHPIHTILADNEFAILNEYMEFM